MIRRYAGFWCFAVFPAIAIAQTTLEFSAPIDVADGTQYGYIYPRIALMAPATPVVMWARFGATNEIYAARLDAGQFTSPVRISPPGIDVMHMPGEYAGIAANGMLVVVAYSTMPFNTAKVYFQKSTDGGNTFGDTVRVASPGNEPPYTASVELIHGVNPIVAYEKAFPSLANPRQAVRVSKDGGASFGSEIVVSIASGQPCECCPPDLATQGDRVVVAYRNNAGNIRDIHATLSSDAGATFPTVYRVDNSNWNYPSCPVSAPSVFIDGDWLMTAWMTGISSGTRIGFSAFDLVAKQLTVEHLLDDIMPAILRQSNPAIAGNRDTLAVVWSENRNDAGDIFISYSDKGALAMSTGITVNADALTGNQRLPDVAFGGGMFHIVYQDDQSKTIRYRTARVVKATGSASLPQQNGLVIGPSPADGFLLIHLHENGVDAIIEVFDAGGRLFHSGRFNGGAAFTMDTSTWPAGTYTLKLSTGDRQPVTRVFTVAH